MKFFSLPFAAALLLLHASPSPVAGDGVPFATQPAQSCLSDGYSSGGIVPWDPVSHTMQGVSSFMKILTLVSLAADPETGGGATVGLKVATGIVGACHSVWKMIGGHYKSENTYQKIYDQAQMLINYDQELAATTQGDSLNANWLEMSRYTERYENFTRDGDMKEACKALENIMSKGDDNMALFQSYYNSTQYSSQMLLAHLPSQATLHMSAYRERVLNPQVCNDSNSTSASFRSEMDDMYNVYMKDYTSWLPTWANWRTALVQNGDRSNRRFEVVDKLGSKWKYCRGWLSRTSNEVAKDFTYGTREAIQKEVVANMLGLLDPMNGIHRILPGREGDDFIYPPSSATWPLNLYRNGIELGPYRQWGGRVYGYRVHDSSEVKHDCTNGPKELGVPTSFQIATDYQSVYTPGIENTKLTYTHGEGCSSGYSTKWQPEVNVPENEYIQTVTLFAPSQGNSGSYRNQLAQNCDYDTVPTKHDGISAHKCQCNSIFAGVSVGLNNTETGVYHEEYRSGSLKPGSVGINQDGVWQSKAIGFKLGVTSDFMLVGYGSAYLSESFGQYDTNTNQHGVENHKHEVCKYGQTVARAYFAPVALKDSFDVKKQRRNLRRGSEEE